MQVAKRAHSPVPLGRRGKAEAQFRRGLVLRNAGELGQAVTAFTAAIQFDADHLPAQRARATTLTAAGRHADAVSAWERVAAACPGDPEITAQLGRALSAAGRDEDAVALLCAAAQRHPGSAEVLGQMGRILLRLGRAKQAVGALLLAIELRPTDADTLSALGIAFLQCDDLAQAQVHAGAAFRLEPSFDNAVNFGRVLLEAGAFEQALAVSSHAILLRTGSLAARNNHALALEGLGRHEDAVQAWRAALAVAPDDTDICHKLATLLLGLGRMTPESWALYERRLTGQVSTGAVRRWAGEDVAGKTVLLHAEQGLGDTLQFVRYAPLVAARGARVVLAVQPGLARLLGTVPGVEQVLAVGQSLPRFDVFCPLLSLPAIFDTTLDTVPPPLPYGTPNRVRAPGVLQVGLVWAGNPGFVNDRRRSVPPALLAPLLAVPNVRFYSLQLGGGPDASNLGMADGMGDVTDFADTASRIAPLDLVIAVDTAVAHLAATMGKPVWLLSRFLGCWRWLFDRTDTPWYPTMCLYRQPRPNDWASVIDRVRQDLAALANSEKMS